MKTNKRRYRKERLSLDKRNELLRFNHALYGDYVKMPAKAKTNSVAVTPVPFSYVDANGIEQNLDLLKVKNLGETAYAESQKLFPNATQCYIGQEGVEFDDEGRQNVIGQNLVILAARRMTIGDYGPWFLLQCAHPEKGEISIPAPGNIANEAIAAMSGIDLKTGERIGPSELPVWARFEFVKGGSYNGYFVIMPAIQELAE